MPFRVTSLTVRRLLPAVMLAAAATLTGSAVGETAVACASPAWNPGKFNECYDPVSDQFLHGDITVEQHDSLLEGCCLTHGGNYDPSTHLCTAPAIAASNTPSAPPSEAANPDVPAGPPSPTKPAPTPGPKAPKTTFTLAPVAPVG
ncbi:hypothetical protein [Mycobacterium sp. IDR2000157661]|uniref:hypothetical protein n=1 Tax=Mycobacterium sp. IDR2000157661 TaxID=2867005 RepID=UPI001EEA4F0D|nr:hypothetical protein [Mycobacterium sp. IDR2000157661]ULE33148.1 hypothetical protein K3G64_24365 [Mycobacterium sp. IDR2000157661]